MLHAGDLNRRVTLQRMTASRNALGEQVSSWSDIGTVAAGWRRASARETLASSEISATVSDIFTIRATSRVSDLSSKDRLIFKSWPYDIVTVTESEDRDYLTVSANARSDA